MSRRLRKLAVLIATALGMLGAGGCIFEPRSAETPGTGAQIQYLPRTGPANIWENCRLALANTDATGWDNNLHSSFRYEPDSQALEQYPVLADWGKEQELNFVNNWFSSGIEIEADLLNEEFNTPQGSGGTAIWDIIYLVTVTDQAGSVTRYRGRATLTFEVPETYWQLVNWRDEGGESDPDDPDIQLQTLGVIRGAFGG